MKEVEVKYMDDGIKFERKRKEVETVVYEEKIEINEDFVKLAVSEKLARDKGISVGADDLVIETGYKYNYDDWAWTGQATVETYLKRVYAPIEKCLLSKNVQEKLDESI